MKFLLQIFFIFLLSSCTPRYITQERYTAIPFGSSPRELIKIVGTPDQERMTSRGKEMHYTERVSYGKGHSINKRYLFIFNEGKLVDKTKIETPANDLFGAELLGEK